MREATVNQTLSTPEFYVLLAVANRVLHGYGIRDQIAFDSGGQFVPAMGTVYPVLDRLVTSGLLERVDVADLQVGRTRIACRYRITQSGRVRLEDEIMRLERVASQARHKLGRRAFGASSSMEV